MKPIIITLIFLLIGNYLLAQDILIKKDGTILKGKVTEEQDGYIKIQTGNVVQFVSKGYILKISYGSPENNQNNSSQINGDNTTNPCQQNNTGDALFENLTNATWSIEIFAIGIKSGDNPLVTSLTILPNESRCAYDLTTGAHYFDMNNHNGIVRDGQVFITKCNQFKYIIH